jgi:hypothetical protein
MSALRGGARLVRSACLPAPLRVRPARRRASDGAPQPRSRDALAPLRRHGLTRHASARAHTGPDMNMHLTVSTAGAAQTQSGPERPRCSTRSGQTQERPDRRLRAGAARRHSDHGSTAVTKAARPSHGVTERGLEPPQHPPPAPSPGLPGSGLGRVGGLVGDEAEARAEQVLPAPRRDSASATARQRPQRGDAVSAPPGRRVSDHITDALPAPPEGTRTPAPHPTPCPEAAGGACQHHRPSKTRRHPPRPHTDAPRRSLTTPTLARGRTIGRDAPR